MNRKKTDFVWNGQNLASETTNDVTTVYGYDLTGIIASTVNGEVTKYVKDPHGNVVVTSRNGSIAGEYDYNAFGEQLTATDTTNPFRYCGEYYDNENGLTYLRNRYYDSDTGRFLSEDPIKDGMNWYSYCGGDPVMMVDPSGCSNIPKWLDWDEDGRIDTKADRARFDSDNNGVADWREEFDDEGPYGVNNNKSAPAWYQCRNSKVLYDFPWRYQAEGVLLCWAYAASEVIEYMTGKNIVPEQIAKDRLTYENSLNDGTVITDYNMGYTTKAASELIKHCGYLNGSGYEVEYMKSFDFNYIKNQIDNNIPAVLSFSVDGGRHDVAVMGYAYDNEIGKEFILYYDSTDNPIPREIAIKSNMRLYSFNKIR